MTNKEIRRDIERRIVLLGGVENAFNNIVKGNIDVIIKQIPNVSKTQKDAMYIANLAVSFSISGFKRSGIINKLYNTVLFERNENVVLDEIMDYAVLNTIELLKSGGKYID